MIAAFALIFSLAIPMGVWGQTSTYTFTSKSWAATLDGNSANWTSGKDGNQMQSGRGVQVTTGVSGANATSPVSFTNVSQVVITYSTNASAGAGSIAIQVGSNEAVSQSVTKTGGTTDRTLAYDFSPYQTGNVKFTVTCTTNSIYIKSIAITTSSGTQNPSDFVLTGAPVTLDFDLFNNNAPQTIYYTTSSSGLVSVEQNNYVNVTVNQQNKTITVTPTAVTPSAQAITVNQAADATYLAGSATFTVNITDSTPAPTYIFNTDAGLAALNITKPASNAGTNLEVNHDYVSGDVTMNITHGTTHTRVWGGTSATDLRVYNGGSLTFSVPSGQQITSIILVGEKPSNFNEIGSKAEHTATWSGTPSLTVTLTANNTCQINTITVVYETNATGVDTPVLPASCNFQIEKEITITGITAGATVYYTTDNTNPETSSTRVEYTAPFTINATTTVKAVAYLNSNYSTVTEATYTRLYNITVTQTTGGTISANKSQAAVGETITLTATANVGYSFSAWNVLPVSVTLNGNSFSMPAADVTVSATFTQSATAYTVSFSVNNKVEMTATVFDGGSIDLTKFVAEGDGYTFEGWSTTLGGENIDPQNAYIPTGNITLYPGVNPAPTGDEYTLVTDASQLVAGNLVVIAANGSDNYAMSTTQNNNNRGKSNSIEKSSDYSKLSITGDDVCELTLGTSNNHWTLYDATNNGYLYAVSGQNYLRTRTDNSADACGEWTIAISNNNATISSQGTTDVRDLKYNASSSIFSCYKSGQQTVYLYTKPASKSVKGNRAVPTTSKVTGIAANVLVTVKSNGVVYLTGSNAGNEANLIVEDGGQLVASNDVKGTMQKTIIGYSSANPGWYFISSPLTSTSVAQVQNLVDGDYDLYYFKQDPEIVDGIGLEWINYKATHFSSLYVGSGYLYANAAQTTTLGFAGTLRKNMGSEDYATYNKSITYEVQGQGGDPNMAGWNLVGNPFPSNAKVDRGFYKMNNTSDGINPTVVSANSVIGPMEGVFVLATENEQNPKVTFTATTDSPTAKSRGININVARQGEMLDNAIVSLNAEGSLCKLILSDNTTKVYFQQDQRDYAIIASPSENEVPVSFKASRNGNYTITVNPEEVEFNYLHLIDNKTGANVDLLATPSYSFEAKTTDYASRFRLVFSATSSEAENDIETFAYFNGNEWMVSNEGEANLQVIDLTGRILSSETINGSVAKAITATPGIYMLRLVNNNETKTQKILVK